MKLFTIGPVQMHERTLRVRGANVPYFRTEEFSEVMYGNRRLLLSLMGAPEGSEPVFLTASGTGAMEAAVVNLFTGEDRLLILSGGTFGRRFEEICRIHRIPFDTLLLSEGEGLTAEHISPFEGVGRYAGMLVNLHETSTGQLYDIGLLRDFCDRNGMLLVVDAISTFLCDPFDMARCGIDVSIISSQKGLCLAPGLSAVVLAREVIEERILRERERTEPVPLYFDFRGYLEDLKRGQTPFTPCVGILYELRDMLDAVWEEGLDHRLETVRERAEHFRGRMPEIGAALPSFPLSNAVTPVWFQEEVAGELVRYLRERKGLCVNPSGGEAGKRSFRVSHAGDLSLPDYDELIEGIKEWQNARC